MSLATVDSEEGHNRMVLLKHLQNNRILPLKT